MPQRKFWYLEYKYPNEPWKEYDRTQVDSWASEQFLRMQRDYPKAEYRKERR